SSIALPSILKGSVPAAVCSASASSLIGIFITPLLVSVTLTKQNAGSSASLNGIWDLVLQILMPFIAGLLQRPCNATSPERGMPVLRYVDLGSILLIVYT